MGVIISKMASILRWIRRFFDASLKGESLKCRLCFPNYFVWSVQANAEKGVAGGTIKVNFSIRSAFILSTLLFLITLWCRPVTQFLIPSIFLFFSLYASKVLLIELKNKIFQRNIQNVTLESEQNGI